MTTKEAWKQLINTDGIEKELGYSPNTVWHKRSQVNQHDEYPSLQQMEVHLLKAGWFVIQEKRWGVSAENRRKKVRSEG